MEKDPVPYVYFGDEVIGGMPFAVSLVNPMEIFICSGTIISLWHVIGACQCIASVNRDWHRTFDSAQFRVLAGLVNLTRPFNSTTMQRRYIHFMLPHPLCHRSKFGVLYDLAIIYLTVPFKLTEYVRPVPMPHMREEDDSSSDVINMMFGYRETACKLLLWTTGNRVYFLQSHQTHILGYGPCQDKLYRFDGGPFCSQCHLCAELKNKLNCSGVNILGSSLLCDNKIFGVLSWNYTCVDNEIPLVFARFDTAMDWVGHWLFVAGGISPKITAEYGYTVISGFIGLRKLIRNIK